MSPILRSRGRTPQDDEDFAVLAAFIDQYWRSAAKAFLIALMMAYAVAAVSNSLGKAFLLGGFGFLLACFNTWRRYLQPISLVVFLAAAVYSCLDATVPLKISAMLTAP